MLEVAVSQPGTAAMVWKDLMASVLPAIQIQLWLACYELASDFVIVCFLDLFCLVLANMV